MNIKDGTVALKRCDHVISGDVTALLGLKCHSHSLYVILLPSMECIDQMKMIPSPISLSAMAQATRPAAVF